MYNRNHCMTGLENGNTALEFFLLASGIYQERVTENG